MSWFHKSPFGRDEDPVSRMVELLFQEADKTGTPLTALDKAILAKESSRSDPMPEDLRDRAKKLITRIYDNKLKTKPEKDPKSFLISLQWASDDPNYQNIVALAEEVAHTSFPPLHGWELIKNRLQLVGCAVLIVLAMFAVVIGAGILLRWK